MVFYIFTIPVGFLTSCHNCCLVFSLGLGLGLGLGFFFTLVRTQRHCTKRRPSNVFGYVSYWFHSFSSISSQIQFNQMKFSVNFFIICLCGVEQTGTREPSHWVPATSKSINSIRNRNGFSQSPT